MADTKLLEGTGSDAGVTFTESDLLAALEAAMRAADDGPADAFTVSQLAEITGRDKRVIREALAALKTAGRLQVVMVKRVRLDDRAVLTAAYRWRANPVEFNGKNSARNWQGETKKTSPADAPTGDNRGKGLILPRARPPKRTGG